MKKIEIGATSTWLGLDPRDQSEVRVQGELVSLDPRIRRAIIDTGLGGGERSFFTA